MRERLLQWGLFDTYWSAHLDPKAPQVQAPNVPKQPNMLYDYFKAQMEK